MSVRHINARDIQPQRSIGEEIELACAQGKPQGWEQPPATELWDVLGRLRNEVTISDEKDSRFAKDILFLCDYAESKFQPPATEWVCGTEWTPEYVEGMFNTVSESGVPLPDLLKAFYVTICDAHNAALSDKKRFFALWRENDQLKQQLAAHEQSWVKVLNNIADEYAQDMIAAQVELDAEREKYQFKANLTQEIVELRQQLLAAQAAMKLHNDINGDVCQIKADLSALDKHDEEMREKGRQEGLTELGELRRNNLGRIIADAKTDRASV